MIHNSPLKLHAYENMSVSGEVFLARSHRRTSLKDSYFQTWVVILVI